MDGNKHTNKQTNRKLVANKPIRSVKHKIKFHFNSFTSDLIRNKTKQLKIKETCTYLENFSTKTKVAKDRKHTTTKKAFHRNTAPGQ
jgi:hypothetical protein